MEQMFIEISQKFPVAAGILSVLYLVSLLNKAIFSALHTYVKSTIKTSDDELLEKVESSRAYKAFAYVLDLVARIKIPVSK